MTVSIRGKQRKFVTRDLEEAETKRTAWESERLHGVNADRTKYTFLRNEDLREAEAAFEMLKGSGFTLKQAVLHLLKSPPSAAPMMSFKDALAQFLTARKDHLSLAHYENYRLRGQAFGDFVGSKTFISDISAGDITRWLSARKLSKKTHNNYRGDLAAIFAWFAAPANRWIPVNPLLLVPKYSKRSMRKGPPQRLSVQQCRDLMAYLEREKPHWCTMFALSLFAALRPDMRNGEVWELAHCVGRDGVDAYYKEGVLQLTVEITKDGRERKTTVHSNLARWIAQYPLTTESICPGDYEEYMAIRAKYSIPHDGLRHTCISAYVAAYGSIGPAASEFGTSEVVIKDSYLSRMSRDEADEFYQIVPAAVQNPLSAEIGSAEQLFRG